MILPVVLIALLLCAGSKAGKAVSECKDWACFAPRTCLNSALTMEFIFHLHSFDHGDNVNDDCAGILMIRPLSKMKWEVVLGSWNSPPTEVKVMHDGTELFACSNDGSKSKATSSLSGFEELKPLPSLSTSCKFIVGDGGAEVILDKGRPFNMTSGAVPVESSITDTDLLSDVGKKLKCELSNVQFEDLASSDEAFKATDIQLLTVSCTDDKFNKLQYKSGDAYEDATSISCVKENNKYQYKIGENFEDGPFYARCMAKVCSLCPDKPTTPDGKAEPTLKDEDDCKTLTCPKFFKIGDDITDEKAVCAKGESGEYKWTIGNKTVEEVECVDQKPCKTITSGCDTPCTLNATSGMPSCPDVKQILSVTVDGKDIDGVSVACDSSKGQLTYTADGKSPMDLPGDANFTCSAVAEEQKVAAAGMGMSSAMQNCLTIATVLCLLIIGASVALYFWKRSKNQKAKDDKSKTGEN